MFCWSHFTIIKLGDFKINKIANNRFAKTTHMCRKVVNRSDMTIPPFLFWLFLWRP